MNLDFNNCPLCNIPIRNVYKYKDEWTLTCFNQSCRQYTATECNDFFDINDLCFIRSKNGTTIIKYNSIKDKPIEIVIDKILSLEEILSFTDEKFNKYLIVF